MTKLDKPNLIEWSSQAEREGRKPRRLRPRTALYASLLTGIAAAAIALLSGRVPFDATVQRAPGSLFVVDDDGFVRNTYLVRITNKLASTDSVTFVIEVEGVPAEDVTVQGVRLGTTESATIPLIIRMKGRSDLPRTIPIEVRVSSPTHNVELPATFKTEGHLASN